MIDFDYDEAFSRNIGFLTKWEQAVLKEKKIAIAGLGGVGGSHLLTLSRLGIESFHLADFDQFESANFNRQAGAFIHTIGKQKIDVMTDMALAINPGIKVKKFSKGLNKENIDSFLEGCDLFIDGLDAFAIDIREYVHKQCYVLHIPAIASGPVGMGTAYFVFLPGKMTFTDYYQLSDQSFEYRISKYLVGTIPKMLHNRYLVDRSRLNLSKKQAPSIGAACNLCAGVTAIQAIKVLLDRGKIYAAPYYHLFDAYENKFICRKLCSGNRHLMQRIKFWAMRKSIKIRINVNSHENRENSKRIVNDDLFSFIVDAGRWAPSAENIQPWRFIKKSNSSGKVILKKSADDINENIANLLSLGSVIENMSIAAKERGYEYIHSTHQQDDIYQIDFKLEPKSISKDPLYKFISIRATNRKYCKSTRILSIHKNKLSASLGSQLFSTWYESTKEQLSISMLSAIAFNIRMQNQREFVRIKENIHWDHQYSEKGIPIDSFPLISSIKKIMRISFSNWHLNQILNRFLGGALLAKLLVNVIPGIFCGGYFFLFIPKQKELNEKYHFFEFIKYGQLIQRFWLTATQLGLSIHPDFSLPAYGNFYHLNKHRGQQSGSKQEKKKALKIKNGIENKIIKNQEICSEQLIFAGRIGVPNKRLIESRSIRMPIDKLIVES